MIDITWQQLVDLEPKLAETEAWVRSADFALALGGRCSITAADARIRSRLRSLVGKQRRRAGDPLLSTHDPRVVAWDHLEGVVIDEWAGLWRQEREMRKASQ